MSRLRFSKNQQGTELFNRVGDNPAQFTDEQLLEIGAFVAYLLTTEAGLYVKRYVRTGDVALRIYHEDEQLNGIVRPSDDVDQLLEQAASVVGKAHDYKLMVGKSRAKRAS